jgi:hypothetical protein
MVVLGVALGSAAAIGCCCAGGALAGVVGVTAGVVLVDGAAGVALLVLAGAIAAAPAAAPLIGADADGVVGAASGSGAAAPPHAQSHPAVAMQHHLLACPSIMLPSSMSSSNLARVTHQTRSRMRLQSMRTLAKRKTNFERQSE